MLTGPPVTSKPFCAFQVITPIPFRPPPIRQTHIHTVNLKVLARRRFRALKARQRVLIDGAGDVGERDILDAKEGGVAVAAGAGEGRALGD